MSLLVTIETELGVKGRGLFRNGVSMLSGDRPLDCRSKVASGDLSHSAIRPYPLQYVSRWKSKQGEELCLRPIRPEDEPLMIRFHCTLSDQTVYMRYFHMEKLSARVAHERLIQKCFIDYDREMALVAERIAPETGQPEIIAVGRLSKSRTSQKGELAVLVSDSYQRHGLGSELVRCLIQIGRDEKLQEIVANILPENYAMRALAKHFDFKIRESHDPGMVIAVLSL